MPRVHHVKKARKAHRGLGVKKGQEYWWWKNRMPGRAEGVKRVSFSPPRPSQVCGNPFTAAVMMLEEQLGGLTEEMGADDVKSAIESVAEEARSLAQEQGDKVDNMPDGLKEGDTGQLLTERQEALDAWADELDAIDVEEDQVALAIEEAQGTSPNL